MLPGPVYVQNRNVHQNVHQQTRMGVDFQRPVYEMYVLAGKN